LQTETNQSLSVALVTTCISKKTWQQVSCTKVVVRARDSLSI